VYAVAPRWTSTLSPFYVALTPPLLVTRCNALSVWLVAPSLIPA
jgi:hypothetical protein